MSTFGEKLDGWIKAIAPGWGAEREAARLALSQAEKLSSSAYRGAFHSRTDRTAPTLRGAGPDWTLERTYDRREIVDRARQLEQNSILAEAMLSRATESVVGVGYALQARTEDSEWNSQAEALWKAWNPLADSRGLCSFDEILALLYRSWLRDGDVGVVKQNSGTLRVLESDEIATPEGYGQPNMVDGVEVDSQGRVVAFHVLSGKPDAAFMGADRRLLTDRVRVPARYVEFMARRQRLGQTRGISAFSGISWILDQLDGNLEAVTVANRMAACLGLVLKRKARLTGLATTTGADGIARKKLRLEPGSFMEVDPDEDIKTVQGNPQAQNLGDFLRILGRMASIAFGLPLEITFMDFERTNYSNARAALLQSWNVWRNHQKMLKVFCSRVYTWKLLNWIEDGLLPAREDALSHSWIAPGWQWLDPVAEIQSNLAAVDAGFKTRADIVMQLGGDFEDVVAQQKRERELMEEAELPIARSTLTRDEVVQPEEPEAADAGPEDEPEDEPDDEEDDGEDEAS